MNRIYSALILITLSSAISAQDASFCTELKSITKIVAQSHYNPKPINDSLSKGVFHLFLNQIDEDKRFFTKADIDNFKNDEYYIDNYLNKAYCDFIDGYAEILQQRINDTKITLEKQRDKSLDYSGVDSLYYSADKDYSYFKDDESVEKYWSKKVRYKVLRKLIETDSSFNYIATHFKQLEAELRPKIIDNEICLLNELEQNKGSIRRFVEEAFLDAYLKYQDPNSSYLSAPDKVLFEQSVANSQLSFGIFTSKKKNGDIVVSHISPGSAAFKSNGIEVDDVILSLSNNKETLETYCTSNATITRFINDEHTKEMTFKLKKKDGQILSLTLQKSNLDVEDNTITGYILKDKRSIGYIKIPSFYTDTESIGGLGVSNDVAQQIYKLQQEQIEGLIIDLRFNGGGSMKEATELSGMFIDRGPVAISKVRGEQSYTIRDPNRGSIFNKPMLILVDQFSASASEFFAAAMQDYNRAIIIGSTTHGKATSQLIGAIDEYRPVNYIKLTTGQFFRVTGKSHQQTGVVPDINLPSIYDNYKTQEVYKAFSMDNTSIDVIMKHRPKPRFNMETLAERSRQRIEKSKAFKSIRAFNGVFVDHYINKNGKYPLSLQYVFSDYKNYNDAYKLYMKVQDENDSIYEVNNTKSTQSILEYNQTDKIQNQKLREELSRDPYIQEAYHIINDYLKL